MSPALQLVTFIVIVGAVAAMAAQKPRETGHALAAVFGLASLGSGLVSLGGGLPLVLAIVLTFVGGGMLAMTYSSFTARARLPWAFLVSLGAVSAFVTLVATPKLARLVDMGMGITLIIPALALTTALSLGLVGHEYRATPPR